MGWIPDLPDPRDYTPDHEEVRRLLAGLKPAPSRQKTVPTCLDLRGDDENPSAFFSAVEDQHSLNCSAVCAVLGIVEYFERRVRGQAFEGSMLFLYKMARKLRRTTGDCGVDLRTTFKALRRFGVPPYELWHSQPEQFDDEPHDVSLAGYARDYQHACYIRLDARDAISSRTKSRDLNHALGSETLRTVKSFLSGGFPVAFGFSVPKSLPSDPNIPYRPSFDSFRGGQAVLAVGYDDQKDTSPRGAILIRNSWGETWGDAGYGWLPYAYIKQGLASDFWTLLQKEWVDPIECSLPTVVAESAPKAQVKSN